jgi:hypothetical protein
MEIYMRFPYIFAIHTKSGGYEMNYGCTALSKYVIALNTFVFFTILGMSQLAAAQSGYSLTVNVPSHPFGDSSVNIDITTANGYKRSISVSTAGGEPSYTFDIPAGQGNSVEVCVYTGLGIMRGQNCQIYTVTGSDMAVSLSAPS